ncbi:MAG TPA: quinoprotein dehydrogenase-associated SoxYZ-like carrier, partial [Rhodocyclaceae bacterium]|nr:quinoprotein dehydrogenase-associated SoxYZ-like carrier [Rhodocyclaceae bacterium]
AGIPALYLEDIEFLDPEDRLLMRVQPFEPVSENPVFTLQQGVPGRVQTVGRDNNGNRFKTWIEP